MYCIKCEHSNKITINKLYFQLHFECLHPSLACVRSRGGKTVAPLLPDANRLASARTMLRKPANRVYVVYVYLLTSR